MQQVLENEKKKKKLYKILFGHVDIDVNLFDLCSTSTRGHQFKLFKHHTNHCTLYTFVVFL